MITSSKPLCSTEVLDFKGSPFPAKLIRSMLKKFDITPLSTQYMLINAFLDPQYRFITAALSRRQGKTFIANFIASCLLILPDKHVLIISPDYNLSSISWDLQRDMLIKKLQLGVEKDNAKDRVLLLENGSSVRCASVNRGDSAVGRSYDFILFDESALASQGGSLFTTALLPTLDKPTSKACFISTPRGRNWFYKYYMRDLPGWVSLKATYHENPRVGPELIAEYRAAMTKAEFAQELEADFTVARGRIWELDTEQIKVIKGLADFYIAGMDIGFRDSTTCVIIGVYGDEVHIVAEYKEAQRKTEEHAEDIKAMLDEYEVDYSYIDSSAQQTRYDWAMTFDISTINAKKSVNDGIQYVAWLCEKGKLSIDPECTETIKAFDEYLWAEATTKTTGELTTQKPQHKDASHLADAVRYALYSSKEAIDNYY